MRRAEPSTESYATPEERARVAWYYFLGDMTQKEIADRMGMTRLRVNRIIGQVRAEGGVTVKLRLPLAGCIDLAERLKARFGLTEATVVPDLGDLLAQKRVVGQAAGVMLEAAVAGRDLGIGVGSGRTLSFAVREVAARTSEQSWVVGLLGGVTRSSHTNTYEVATALARALDVECHYLTAPIYCASPEARDALLLNDELTDVLARTEIADVAVVSCGSPVEESALTQVRVIKDHLDDIARMGAVGEILGCFIDEWGRPIEHFINDTIIALPPEKLRLKPVSILVSGGVVKVPIIRAILRGRYVNRLVTNEGVARALLDGPD